MKLLIIHNKYQSNNIGGEGIVFKNELEFLQAKLGKENVFSYEVSNDDINKIKLIFGIWFNRYYYKEVKKIVEEKNIDLVHIHNFYPLLTPSIFKAAKDAGAKVVHTLHNYRLWCISGILYRNGFGICEQCINSKISLAGIFNKCYHKSLSQSILVQMSYWFYHLIGVLNNIDYFFVLTNFQKKKVISFGIDEKKIILKPNSQKVTFYKTFCKKNYIYVGRLEEAKGVYELLDVWNKLDEKYILILIGSGILEKKLKKKYYKSNIIFKGKCSREETLNHIASSKYLIQPSLWYETFGLTIIEAMGLGIPVIGHNIGTRKEFIKNGKNGFLYKSENLKDVIEKSFVYRNYEKLSNNAIETAKLYENNFIIEKQLKIYEKIIASKI